MRAPVGGPGRPRRGNWWTPSSMSFGLAWRGGSCLTTCRHGRRSIIICAAGSAKGSGSASTTPSSWPTASAAAGRRRPRRRSSTASRYAPPIKRGRQGLRCGQEDQQAKAAHPDRHRRAPSLRACPWRQYPGPRRRQADAEGLPPALSLVARVFADGGYAGRLVQWAADCRGTQPSLPAAYFASHSVSVRGRRRCRG